ncbi:MAG: WYL domain-containing protein [Clostridiales bacterium]|nr:WYL domain-containing protein [Clostridiales bacterium]
MNINGRKMKLLTLQKILEEQTDIDHCLTATQIVEKLNILNIQAERKGIYDDIEALNMFYAPTDKRKTSKALRIEKDESGKGYYLDNRLFSVSDLKLMIDAIQSSKFLSEAKTIELIEALETLCTKRQAYNLRRQVIVSNRVKNMNTNIHNNVDHINSAIESNEQIRFKYFDYDVKQERLYRKKGAWYVRSPFALVYSDDNYYLLAHDAEKDKIMNFRVDRMASISSTFEPRTGKEAFDKIDLAKYQKYTFSMYSGKIENVTMVFRNNMMNSVIDKFGRQGYAKAVDKDHFEITVPVAVSPQFFGWIFGLGNYVRITSPDSVKEKMKKALSGAMERYE